MGDSEYYLVEPNDFIAATGWTYERIAEEFCVSRVTVTSWFVRRDSTASRRCPDSMKRAFALRLEVEALKYAQRAQIQTA